MPRSTHMIKYYRDYNDQLEEDIQKPKIRRQKDH